jgi:hypothetical protein
MARKRLPSLLSLLTDRVVAVKAETGADLHIALSDATGDKPRIVVVEVPAKPRWCSIRETVFSWARTKFAFQTSSAKKPNVTNPQSSLLLAKHFSTSGILQKIMTPTSFELQHMGSIWKLTGRSRAVVG